MKCGGIFDRDSIKNTINKNDNNYKINFQMPTRIAIDIYLEFGLGEAELDFTNLRISQLKMDCGLSDVRMKVSKPNRIDCDIVEISTGISDYNGTGLGNFNSSKYVGASICSYHLQIRKKLSCNLNNLLM